MNVATLRLEQIRAGMEEYEILYALGRAYEDSGVSFRKTFDYLMSFMSRGIKIIADNNVFLTIRRLLLDLYELNISARLCVYDIRQENGFIHGSILSDEDFSVLYKDVELTGRILDGKKIYDFSVPASSACFGIKEKDFYRSFDIGNIAEQKTISAKTLLENVNDCGFGIEFIYNDVETESGIQLIMPTDKGLVQSFELSIPKDIDLERAVSLILRFDNEKDGKKFEGIDIKAKFEKEENLRPMLSTETYLPPLKSSMPVYLSNNDWSKSGRLEYLLLSFGEDNEEYRLLSENTPVKKYIRLCSAELLYKRKS